MPLDAEREAPVRALDRLGQLVERRPAGDDEARRRARRRPGGGATSSRAAPRRPRARRASPSARRDVVVGERRRASSRCSSWPTTSGRCWCSVPPAATFMTCIPRQMPSSGRSRSSARRASASSNASRSSFGGSVAACGVGAVGRRVDVDAAGEDQPVERVEHRVGVVERRLVGRQQQRDAARALDGARRSRPGPSPRGPPTRPSGSSSR